MEESSLVGSVFADRYEIAEAVGEGGMAVVYRARDLKHGRDVAVKVLRPELTQSFSYDRFVREVGIAARLSHPNILPLYDSGEGDGRFYYVTPFIEGDSLRDRLDQDGQLPIVEAVSTARAVAAALECAHAHGIVHRDIKPENILLSSGQALVSDFGIARVLETSGGDRLTATGIVVGTPAYMSPEQAVGDSEVGPLSDIFSLGCVLYEMLVGGPPFHGNSVQALIASRFTQDVADVREERGEVPRSLAELVSAMLARQPSERVQNATALRELLTAVEAECAAISGSTYTRIAGRTIARARRRALRSRRVAVAAVGTAALIGTAWLARDRLPLVGRLYSGTRVSTLAVLPLVNLSGDVEQEFFADGLTDALITDLSQVPGVKVISRTSVMQYKLVRKSIREIARELNADALLEGALMREGERVRITAKLVRGSDEQNLWNASYDGRMGELLDLQREVGFAVAREIGARIGSRTTGRQVSIKPESQTAFLRGAYYAGQWRLEEAIASFQRSVEIDPANAGAYAALGRAYYFRTFFGEIAAKEAFSQMRRAAAAALQQDPQLGEAHGLMALVNTHYDYDWAAAEANFARALRLSPSNAQVHHDYAHFLLAMGRGPESVEESRRAVELDPANPMLTSCLGWHSLFEARFDQALEHAAEAQQLMPNFWAQIVQGWAQSSKGLRAEAVQSMREAVSLGPELGFTQAALAHTLARSGAQGEAREILAALLERAQRGYISAYDVALVYAGLDENDNALEWLARAIAERSVFVVHLTWDSRLDMLRDDRRFAELLARLELPSGRTRPRAVSSSAVIGRACNPLCAAGDDPRAADPRLMLMVGELQAPG
jgi:eukaryotic-like serine/threonine-protein kinase